jgi:hypothetical protein
VTGATHSRKREDDVDTQPTEAKMSSADPKHDWWDWYARHLDAREHGSRARLLSGDTVRARARPLCSSTGTARTLGIQVCTE